MKQALFSLSPEEKKKEADEMRNDMVNDHIKTLNLDGSIYEYAFWLMYHEDNPVILREVTVKCCFAAVVTLLLTMYYITARASVVEENIHYGTWSLNVVRTICILMLHLKMYPHARDSRNMLQFCLNNSEKFASQSVVFPVLLCFFKLAISFITEGGNLYLMMFFTTEIQCIFGYVSLAVIVTIEDKMMKIMRETDAVGAMGDKPLQYFAKMSASGVCRMSLNYFRKWENG